MNLVCSVEFDFNDDALVDGAREHITSIVVSVLSDEVDSSGRCEHIAVRTIEEFEFLLNSGFHFHNSMWFN